HLDTDVFQTKLGGKNVICMSGQEAAEIFYDEEKFERLKVLPQIKLTPNANEKMSIHNLDDKQWEQLFNELLSSTRINELNSLYLKKLQERLENWTKQEQIIFFDEMKQL